MVKGIKVKVKKVKVKKVKGKKLKGKKVKGKKVRGKKVKGKKVKVKVKCSLYRPGVAQRVGRGIALLFYDRGTRRWGEWSASRPGRSLPPGKTRYPLYRRLGGPQGRSGRVRKISSPPGFDPGPSSPAAQSLYRLSYRAQGIIVVEV